MFFIFALSLLVLPLFLLVCIQIINQSSWAKSPGGIALKMLFYVFAIGGILGAIMLLLRV